ncbi:MAG: sulfite exporter TauE/SafE family protein, partial [Sphingobacteriaceae bacterium]
LAFFIGLLGSVHCVGMCGPLVFSVPPFKTQRFFMITDKLVYQLGRVFSYTLLGVLMGLLGKQVWLSAFQQSLSLLTGMAIVLAAFVRFFKWSIKLQLPFFTSINKVITYAYQHKANHLIVGVLNGFLPCGLVYLALAGAVNTGSVALASRYMFFFGMGTIPLVLLAAVGVSFFQPYFKVLNAKVIPIFMLLLGCWFIARGLTLDIPYLSPAKANTEANCD